MSTTTVAWGPLWVALGQKLFTKHGVEVEVSYSSPTVVALLTSGQIDLMVASFAGTIPLQAQGQPAKEFFTLSNYDWRSSAVLSKPSIRSIDDLRALGSECKLGAGPPGTPPYAWALGFMKANSLKCQLITLPSLSAQTAAIASGAVEATVTQPQAAVTAADTGVGRIIFDPMTTSDADGQKILEGSYPLLGVSGLKDNVAAKKPAVVAFIRALREGMAIVNKSTPEQLAKITLRVKDAWGTTSNSSITSAWALTKQSIPTGEDAGFISRAGWKDDLDFIVESGVTTIDPDNSALAYKNAVDMSYFRAAGAPKGS